MEQEYGPQATGCTKNHDDIYFSDTLQVLGFDLRNDPKELENVVDDSRYANTISSLISEHLDPLKHRIDMEKLSDYREYVRETGQLN